MPIDVHTHYVPPTILEALETRAGEFGITVDGGPAPCNCALHFDYGLKLRPFFPPLVETEDERLAGMARQGVERQVLSIWGDIFGYGLAGAAAASWHRLLNEHLARVCERHPDRFSMLASVPLPDAQAAAAELQRAVNEHGALGVIVAANVNGENLGEFDLDPLWQTAVDLDVGVFIHPVEPVPAPRARRWALAQIAQYTYDTTLCVGSLINTGVLDRFAKLRLLLSHGGGTFPYLTGRFDRMHQVMDRAAQGNVAVLEPSGYLPRFHYDTVVHDPAILAWLAGRVGVDRIVLGSDYSFPPADPDPVTIVRTAGFSAADQARILETNPLALFPRLRGD
jgi:aminocarboxymuconate-semialdehyde decarboxylase